MVSSSLHCRGLAEGSEKDFSLLCLFNGMSIEFGLSHRGLRRRPQSIYLRKRRRVKQRFLFEYLSNLIGADDNGYTVRYFVCVSPVSCIEHG